MDKLKKLALIKRSLGIRHKLKVHESMKAPETHEDLAILSMSKWELEDELLAIEEILAEDRARNVKQKKSILLQTDEDEELEVAPKKPYLPAAAKSPVRKRDA